MAHHVLGRETRDLDAAHAVKNADRMLQAARNALRKVDLRHVARDHSLGTKADASEKHLHLLGRRVLGLVKDDERIVECAASHVGERRHLDRLALHEAL